MTTRENGSEQGPVIRDNRKIDPETGQVRERAMPEPGDILDSVPEQQKQAGAEPKEDKGAVDSRVEELTRQLAERTEDLQRVQAEYANYRKRVERDRAAVRELAVASVLTELLPVLDDIGRAREHGELVGGFAKVSEVLESVLGKFGLESFGEKGDPFDPTVHEALMHSYSSEVTETTCVEILQLGYRIGDRILRPARVAVAEPEPQQDAASAADAASSEEPSSGGSSTTPSGESGESAAGESSSQQPAGSGDGSGGASGDGSATASGAGDDN